MTLLPNKHIPTSRSLVGIGALVLGHLERPTNVSRLWESVKDEQEVKELATRYGLARRRCPRALSRVLGTSCCRSTISLLLERLITNADC